MKTQSLIPDLLHLDSGPSLGAALAYLTQMDLIKKGIPTTIYNFGQPRAGDKDFSAFVTANNITPNS